MKNIIIYVIFIMVLQSCAPIVGVLGVATVGSVAKEKGFGTSISDTIIFSKITNLTFKYNANVFNKTKFSINNGSVLITGKVKTPKEKIQITKIAWGVKGVKEVNNEIQITDISSIKNTARDLASVAEIRARIMSDSRINSLNISIDVVNDIAYLSGVTKNKVEMNFATDHATNARFVKQVISYIIVNTDTR